MSLTTYTLTVQVFKQDGSPASGATVTAVLSAYDKTAAKNYVIPTFVQATVDGTGVATLNLFPNIDGLRGSYYRLTARDAGVVYFDIQFLMPAQNSNFADIDDNYTGFPITSPLAWPDLTAIEALGGTGVPVRISSGNWTQTDLGTMATQNANNVNITGGLIDGVTIQNVAAATNADGVTFTPAGGIAATDVQAALEELDSEKAPKASPAFTGSGSIDAGAAICRWILDADSGYAKILSWRTDNSMRWAIRVDGGTDDDFFVRRYNNSGVYVDAPISAVRATGVVTIKELTLTTTLDETYGGTGQTSYAQGDILYASAPNTLAKLTKGTANQVLAMNAGETAPEWKTLGAGAGDVVGPASSVDNELAVFSGTGGKTIKSAATSGAVLTVNSASAALTVTQTGSGNAFVVEDSASPDSSPFVIDAEGRAISGHTASVSGQSGQMFSVQIHGTGYNTARQGIFRWSANANNPGFEFYKSRNATIGSHTIVQSGDGVGEFQFSGSDGANFIPAAIIRAEVDGTPSTGIVPGRVVISTANSSGTITERMRIDSSGNVAQGTSGTSANYSFFQSKSVTGATTVIGFGAQGVVQSDVTVSHSAFRSNATTAAASFTLSSLQHFEAGQPAFGVGSSVTNQYGFLAGASLTGATNNYGFFSNIASGTGRWNFYANGTARNYFAGPSSAGVTTDNDLSFDMNATNHFVCTTSGPGTLTFTNIATGQSGNILLVNSSNHTISKAAAVKCSSTFLSTVSVTGTYWISYFSPNGTDVYVTTSGAMT